MVDERFFNDNELRKVETSIPVQSRIDVIALAEMVRYWEEEGYYVRTMSQLVNWSVDLCAQILRANNKMPLVINSVLEAGEELSKRGLYQRSMKQRSKNKLIRARQLENMRLDGVNPKSDEFGSRIYNKAHNNHSMPPAPDVVNDFENDKRRRLNEEASARAFERIREEEIAKAKEAITSRLTFDENGVAIIPKTEGMYTAEDRKREIALTRERLGLTKSGSTEGSVGSSEKQPSNECKEDDEKEGQTPASVEEEALSLFNKVRDKQVVSAKRDLTPRKLTSSEVMSKEEKLKQKDRVLKSQLDLVTPNDLSPIDD